MLPSKKSINYLSLETYGLISGDPETYLIDVRTEDAFNECHIPGSVNICVYEVVFLDKIRENFPDPDSALIVYGESSEYKAAEVAFARLEATGFKNVQVLEGGLEAWQDAEKKSSCKSVLSVSETSLGKLSLDTEQSKLRWIGRNPTNQHDGQIALKSGWIQIEEGGAVLSGEVVVDMQAISCLDITDSKMNSILIAHLNNSDFFEVERYPEASFSITQSEPIPGFTPGQPNLDVSGMMTLRGVTRPIDFQAMLTPLPEGVSFQAQLDVNRVLFGAVYGSGSIFERLGMHLVNDLVNIQITAVFS